MVSTGRAILQRKVPNEFEGKRRKKRGGWKKEKKKEKMKERQRKNGPPIFNLLNFRKFFYVAERHPANTRQHRRSLGQGEGCVCANAGKAGRGRVAL